MKKTTTKKPMAKKVNSKKKVTCCSNNLAKIKTLEKVRKNLVSTLAFTFCEIDFLLKRTLWQRIRNVKFDNSTIIKITKEDTN